MRRIFSGIQPSGDIHIGNYVGAIRNWVKLLEQVESIFCIVDYHAMTVEYPVPEMKKRIFDAALVNIACGLDPKKCIIFVQSEVPEHTELTWILNCVTPVGDLERMTQFKDKSEQHRENVNMGLMDYPVLMAADILLYKADAVPVGEDQVQHIEFARRTARRFNHRFGEIFPEPEVVLGSTPRILGLDGKSKMSKSLNNTIGVLEPPEATWEKLRTAVTDENRKRRSDPGNPDICNIFTMHKAFSPPDVIEKVDRECRTAGIGCVECKRLLFEHMMAELKPIQERAKALFAEPGAVSQTLLEGAQKAKKIAAGVMKEVLNATGIR